MQACPGAAKVKLTAKAVVMPCPFSFLIRRPIKPLRAARKYLAAILSNADAVFELRAQAPVARYRRPAVFQNLARCLADVDHRLDGENHAGAQFGAGSGTSGVDDFGGVVE